MDEIEKLIAGGAVAAVITVVVIFVRHLSENRKFEQERDKLFTETLKEVSKTNADAVDTIRKPIVEMGQDLREMTVHMRNFTGQVETHFPRKRQT